MTVEETAVSIRNMSIRGAGKIARACASALYELAESYEGDDPEELFEMLEDGKETLLASRPTAVSLYNGVMYSLKGVGKWMDAEEMRKSVMDNADEFIENSLQAVQKIGELGADIIDDGDVLMTHCNSSAAVSVIKTAHQQGKRIKVYATETRPWRQGLITSRELAEAGVDVTLIVDSAVRLVMEDVDKVFVGADTVTAQGTLFNKVGTSQLALAAKELDVPFYVCSETYKFSPLSLNGDNVRIELRDTEEVVKDGDLPKSVKIYNPVFDRTPAKYIDTYITEKGGISPYKARDLIIEQFGIQEVKQ